MGKINSLITMVGFLVLISASSFSTWGTLTPIVSNDEITGWRESTGYEENWIEEENKFTTQVKHPAANLDYELVEERFPEEGRIQVTLTDFANSVTQLANHFYASGRRIRVEKDMGGGAIRTTTFSYNDRGFEEGYRTTQSSSVTGEEHSFELKYEYRYDQDGALTTTIEKRFIDDTLQAQKSFTFNGRQSITIDSGGVTEQLSITDEGDISSTLSGNVEGTCSYSAEQGSGNCQLTEQTELHGIPLRHSVALDIQNDIIQSEKVTIHQVASGEEISIFERELDFSTDGKIEEVAITIDGETLRDTPIYDDEYRLAETQNYEFAYQDGGYNVIVKGETPQTLFESRKGSVGNRLDTSFAASNMVQEIQGAISDKNLDLHLRDVTEYFDLDGNLIAAQFSDGDVEEFFYGPDNNLFLYIDADGGEHPIIDGVDVSDTQSGTGTASTAIREEPDFFESVKNWLTNTIEDEDFLNLLES